MSVDDIEIVCDCNNRRHKKGRVSVVAIYHRVFGPDGEPPPPFGPWRATWGGQSRRFLKSLRPGQPHYVGSGPVCTLCCLGIPGWDNYPAICRVLNYLAAQGESRVTLGELRVLVSKAR